MRHWQSLPSVLTRAATPLLRRRPRPLRVDVPADVQGGAFPAGKVDDAPCQFHLNARCRTPWLWQCLAVLEDGERLEAPSQCAASTWRNGFTAGVLGHLRVDQRRSGRRASGVLWRTPSTRQFSAGKSRGAFRQSGRWASHSAKAYHCKDSLPSDTAAFAKSKTAERSRSRRSPPTATLGSSTMPVEQAPRDSPRGSSMRVNGSSQGGGSASKAPRPLPQRALETTPPAKADDGLLASTRALETSLQATDATRCVFGVRLKDVPADTRQPPPQRSAAAFRNHSTASSATSCRQLQGGQAQEPCSQCAAFTCGQWTMGYWQPCRCRTRQSVRSTFALTFRQARTPCRVRQPPLRKTTLPSVLLLALKDEPTATLGSSASALETTPLRKRMMGYWRPQGPLRQACKPQTPRGASCRVRLKDVPADTRQPPSTPQWTMRQAFKRQPRTSFATSPRPLPLPHGFGGFTARRVPAGSG